MGLNRMHNAKRTVTTSGGYDESDIRELIDKLSKGGVVLHTLCDAFTLRLVVDELDITWDDEQGTTVVAANGEDKLELPGFRLASITFPDGDYPVVTFAPVVPVARRLKPAFSISKGRKGCGK